MTISIVQVRNRAEQGQTRPFLCRGDDERWYYVKGKGAGRRSLLSEFVAGRMATAFGLPIAPYAVVDVPQALIQPMLGLELDELGSGHAFASQLVPYCQEITMSHLDRLSTAQMQDILVFDWWIRNGDRSLTEKGGNPNLLWNVNDEALVVIDHNVVFELEMDVQSFLDTHVFNDEVNSVFSNWTIRDAYIRRLSTAFAAYDQACEDAPEEWWWHAEDVPSDFDRRAIRAMLLRFEQDDFWNLNP